MLATEQETVRLITRGAAQTTVITPSVSQIHPTLGAVLVDKARVVKSTHHQAEMPAEWLPLLRMHSAYTGQGQPKSVWIEGEEMPDDFEQTRGPAVRDGAMSSIPPARPQAEPIPGWRTAGSGQVRAWIRNGQVRDVAGALQFELANGRRKMVVKTLAAAFSGDLSEPLPDAAAEVAAPEEETLPPVYASPLPPDARGV